LSHKEFSWSLVVIGLLAVIVFLIGAYLLSQ
jgi:uncharacterized membrane protein YhdT